MLLNQWANVVRWGMRPGLFLRTTGFLWQEGPTAPATREDATQYALQIHLDVYRDFLQNVLAIPVLVGVKTRRERFAGAINTMTCEAMMGDGKALQMATSHELGQNFARALDITYTDTNGQAETCWTTSWGSSTRMVGGLIMAHGDDQGLRIPPPVAPVQAVVVAVKDDERTMTTAGSVVDELVAAGVRTRLDTRTSQGFGRRATEWELKGVSIRIEVGPRDPECGQATIARRDTGDKTPLPLAAITTTIPDLLETMHTKISTRHEWASATAPVKRPRSRTRWKPHRPGLAGLNRPGGSSGKTAKQPSTNMLLASAASRGSREPYPATRTLPTTSSSDSVSRRTYYLRAARDGI